MDYIFSRLALGNVREAQLTHPWIDPKHQRVPLSHNSHLSLSLFPGWRIYPTAGVDR